jgi:hypothetical protein
LSTIFFFFGQRLGQNAEHGHGRGAVLDGTNAEVELRELYCFGVCHRPAAKK